MGALYVSLSLGSKRISLTMKQTTTTTAMTTITTMTTTTTTTTAAANNNAQPPPVPVSAFQRAKHWLKVFLGYAGPRRAQRDRQEIVRLVSILAYSFVQVRTTSGGFARA